ncbi:CAP domain-containing protein [Nocardia sp. NPDC058633]|uniref:CAP domain-containing protein n=1 Tax=Nocardia sp. NPDC058633 TaxID=3346568 RepID=UPI003653D446
MLNAHNTYRAKHGSPKMVLDPAVSASAQKWAENLANTQNFAHSQGSGNGENITAVWGGRHTGYNPAGNMMGDNNQHFRDNVQRLG